MTRPRTWAQPPVLADPGYGRTWVPERFKAGYSGRQLRWGVSLMSRTGTLVGYIAEYDNGWGANSIVRGKRKHAGGDGYRTAQAAADALLKARKARR
jgi:hypothetical protein